MGDLLEMLAGRTAARPWTVGEIAGSYLDSVRARFERHNKLVIDYAVANLGPGSAAESELWRLYSRCTTRWEASPIGGPCVTVSLPAGRSINLDYLDMFARHSTVQLGPFVLPAGRVSSTVEDVDSEPSLLIEVGLVDAWNDARQAWWRLRHDAEGRPRS